MNKIFYASVLLHNEKIKFWKVSPNKRSRVEDYYKDFLFCGESLQEFIAHGNFKVEYTQFIESEEMTNDDIFNELAPNWFRRWDLVEGYKGLVPYNKEEK